MKAEIFVDLNTVGEKVFFLLKNVPKTRENDDELIATFILNEVGTEQLSRDVYF
jgi:hypothetical protein